MCVVAGACEPPRRRHAQVDMLVGDIYGGDYTTLGLNQNTVASSFGKLVLRILSPDRPLPPSPRA